MAFSVRSNGGRGLVDARGVANTSITQDDQKHQYTVAIPGVGGFTCPNDQLQIVPSALGPSVVAIRRLSEGLPQDAYLVTYSTAAAPNPAALTRQQWIDAVADLKGDSVASPQTIATLNSTTINNSGSLSSANVTYTGALTGSGLASTADFGGTTGVIIGPPLNRLRIRGRNVTIVRGEINQTTTTLSPFETAINFTTLEQDDLGIAAVPQTTFSIGLNGILVCSWQGGTFSGVSSDTMWVRWIKNGVTTGDSWGGDSAVDIRSTRGHRGRTFIMPVADTDDIQLMLRNTSAGPTTYNTSSSAADGLEVRAIFWFFPTD